MSVFLFIFNKTMFIYRFDAALCDFLLFICS